MLTFMTDSIAKVSAVRFTGGLKDHPACISSGGGLSANMAKTLNRMPGSEDEKVKAELVLEINLGHPVADKLKALYEQDRDKLASYSRLLYYDARMISGLPVDDPADLSSLLIALMTE
jgi:molecular chaperone HtpG